MCEKLRKIIDIEEEWFEQLDMGEKAMDNDNTIYKDSHY